MFESQQNWRSFCGHQKSSGYTTTGPGKTSITRHPESSETRERKSFHCSIILAEKMSYDAEKAGVVAAFSEESVRRGFIKKVDRLSTIITKNK